MYNLSSELFLYSVFTFEIEFLHSQVCQGCYCRQSKLTQQKVELIFDNNLIQCDHQRTTNQFFQSQMPILGSEEALIALKINRANWIIATLPTSCVLWRLRLIVVNRHELILGQRCNGLHNKKVSSDQRMIQAMPQNIAEFIIGEFTYRDMGSERTGNSAILSKLFSATDSCYSSF